MVFLRKRKKQTEPITNAKFKDSQFVGFHVNNELYTGYIYAIHRQLNGDIVYDIQIGGECPAIKRDVPENKIFAKK